MTAHSAASLRVTGTVALARRLVTAIARPDSVRRLLALGADPRARDGRSETALEACRREAVSRLDEPGYAEVAALLAARAC